METKKWTVAAHGYTAAERPSYFVPKLEKIRFGKHEVECAVRTLVNFFVEWRDYDQWREFSLEELREYLKSRPDLEMSVDQALFGLICPWYDDGGFGCWIGIDVPFIVQTGRHQFAVTSAFIEALQEKD